MDVKADAVTESVTEVRGVSLLRDLLAGYGVEVAGWHAASGCGYGGFLCLPDYCVDGAEWFGSAAEDNGSGLVGGVSVNGAAEVDDNGFSGAETGVGWPGVGHGGTDSGGNNWGEGVAVCSVTKVAIADFCGYVAFGDAVVDEGQDFGQNGFADGDGPAHPGDFKSGFDHPDSLCGFVGGYHAGVEGKYCLEPGRFLPGEVGGLYGHGGADVCRVAPECVDETVVGDDGLHAVNFAGGLVAVAEVSVETPTLRGEQYPGTGAAESAEPANEGELAEEAAFPSLVLHGGLQQAGVAAVKRCWIVCVHGWLRGYGSNDVHLRIIGPIYQRGRCHATKKIIAEAA